MAVFAEMFRGIVDTVAELPTITRSDGSVVADTVYVSATPNKIKRHANQFVKLLFNDTLVALHPYFRDYGEALVVGFESVTELFEASYNSTLAVLTGVPSAEAMPVTTRDYSKGVSQCESHIAYSDDIVSRPRMAINLWVKKYSSRVVPLQISFLEKTRDIIAFKFFSVAFAETATAVWILVVRLIEAVLRLGAYLTDSLMRFDYVSRLCMDAYTADVWEKFDDYLTAFPNAFTSLSSFEDTYGSGYSNIACARTTHVDHVYSGSLKAYVFASRACRTRYKDTLSTPKCPYRDDDPAVQAALCEKLVAFAEYNTNPVCNGGDVYVEMTRSLVLILRTLTDYFLGTLVGVWNCVIDSGKLDFAGCAESLSGEVVPSRAFFDVAECQIAEFIYRVSTMVVSTFTPLFDAMYVNAEYPKDGFYATGADDLQHVQARPIEVAFTTVLTSVGGSCSTPSTSLPTWEGRVDDPRRRDEGVLDIASLLAYRRTFVVVQLRSVMLFFRDLIVALTQFARAVDTVSHYKEAKKTDPSPDPKKTSAEFLAFQKTVGDVLEIVQSLGELVSETFIEGIEAFFEMIFYLLEALMKTALGDATASESLDAFFETLIDKIGSLVTDVVNGIFMFLVRKPEGSMVNPFRVLFCDVLGSLKDGVCDALKTDFIPTGLKIHCIGRDGCKWLSSGDLSLTSTPSSSPDSFYVLDSRTNPGTGTPATKPDPSTYKETVYQRTLSFGRRRLQWGVVGDAVEDGADEFQKKAIEAVKPITDGIEDLANEAKKLAVNEANKVANKAKGFANKAIDFAKDAVDEVVDAANAAANVANKLWDWVEDIAKTIKESLPDVSRWSATTSSISRVMGIEGFVNNQMGCKDDGIAQCDSSAYVVPDRQEPTVCSSELECHATDAYCWTPESSACLSTDFVAEGGEKWAKSCRCDLLAGGKYHCNYASGYCEMGATPFAPPRRVRVVGRARRRIRRVRPSVFHLSRVEVRGPPQSRILSHPRRHGDPPLQGPSLCRSFCAPTWENRNNRLAQLVFADGTRKCACEVGFDRAFPTADPSTTTATIVNVPVTYQTAKTSPWESREEENSRCQTRRPFARSRSVRRPPSARRRSRRRRCVVLCGETRRPVTRVPSASTETRGATPATPRRRSARARSIATPTSGKSTSSTSANGAETRGATGSCADTRPERFVLRSSARGFTGARCTRSSDRGSCRYSAFLPFPPTSCTTRVDSSRSPETRFRDFTCTTRRGSTRPTPTFVPPSSIGSSSDASTLSSRSRSSGPSTPRSTSGASCTRRSTSSPSPRRSFTRRTNAPRRRSREGRRERPRNSERRTTPRWRERELLGLSRRIGVDRVQGHETRRGRERHREGAEHPSNPRSPPRARGI